MCECGCNWSSLEAIRMGPQTDGAPAEGRTVVSRRAAHY